MQPQSKQYKATIAIFCHELKAGGDPFSNDFYWQAYQDLLLALKSRGVDAYFVTDNNTYRGYGIFTKAYTLNTKTTVEKLIKVDNLHVDLVFDRGGFIGRDVLMINPPIITKIAQSKIEMYKYFTGLQPYSLVSHNKGEAVAAAEKIPGDKIVVKEPEGSGGKEVYIGDKEKVLAELPDRYPILIQEFLDTSPGIPGIVEGVHDVRVSLCGGDVISYYIRSAKEGEQRANVAQGGKMLYLDAKEVPADYCAPYRASTGCSIVIPVITQLTS